MRVITTKTINAYRQCYPEADEALRVWVAIIKAKSFKHFMDLKETFSTASLIKDDCVVFNIKGNSFRLVARINFHQQATYVQWFGRHKDYDKINPLEVKYEYPPC